MDRETISAEEFKRRMHLTDDHVAVGTVRYVDKTVHINDLLVVGEVLLEDRSLKPLSIIISRVQFCNDLRFNDVLFDRLHFIDCHFNLLEFKRDGQPATVQNCNIETLVLTQTKAKAEFISSCKSNHIVLRRTQLDTSWNSALRAYKTLYFDGCTMQNYELNLLGQNRVDILDKIEITECTAPLGFTIANVRAKLFYLDSTGIMNGDLEINNAEFTCLVIKDSQIASRKLKLYDVRFISSSTQLKDARLVITKTTSVSISEFKCAEISWSSCDWATIKMFIAGNVIDRVSTIDSTICRSIKPLRNNWKEVSDFYGLLESNAKANGRVADSITLRAGGLRAYRNYLKINNRDYNDQITLILSEWISEYGSNWLRAVFVLLTTGYILFLVLVLGFDERVVLGIDKHTIPTLITYTTYYLDFLSPIHGEDFLGIPLEGTAKVIDSLARVWIGFIIYQLIRSTRKFVT